MKEDYHPDEVVELKSEKVQALYRIFFTVMSVIAVVLDSVLSITTLSNVLVGVVGSYILLSIAHWYCFPSTILSTTARRGILLVGDLGIISLLIHYTTSLGLLFYFLYLGIVVSFGLRFGIRYLYYGVGVSVVLFLLSTLTSTYWLTRPDVLVGFVFGLIFLPIFYANLLIRLESTKNELEGRVVEARKLATHDALTGLPNRLLFNDRLQYAARQAVRSKMMVGLLFMDLDGFKPINDRMGHGAGDEALQLVGQRLQLATRKSDTVARIGGDEFAIVLTKITNHGDAIIMAKKILRLFDEPFIVHGIPVYLGTSIGVAVFPDDVDGKLEDLMSCADMAMYRAKANKLGYSLCKQKEIT